MSDKPGLTDAELALTQKIQTHFPRGKISPEVIRYWNSCSAKELAQILLQTFGNTSLLKNLGGIADIPEITESSTVCNCLEVMRRCGCKISVDVGFRNLFYDKIVEPTRRTQFQYQELIQTEAGGSLIVCLLGGEDKAETNLAEFFWLIDQQKNGEGGALLIDGYANIFFIRDKTGVLRVVSLLWYSHRWNLYASFVDCPDILHCVRRVFSRAT